MNGLNFSIWASPKIDKSHILAALTYDDDAYYILMKKMHLEQNNFVVVILTYYDICVLKKTCKYKNALWQLKKLKVTNDGIRVFWLFLPESRIQIRSKFCMFFSIHLHYHDRLKIWKISVFFGMVMLILVLWGLGWFFLLFLLKKCKFLAKKSGQIAF